MKIEFLTSENVGTCEPRGKLVIGKWPARTYLQSAYRRRYQEIRKRTKRRGMFHEIAPLPWTYAVEGPPRCYSH